MEDDALYKQAVSDVRDLVDDVMSRLDDFADEYDYDREWIRDRFRDEFNRMNRKTRQ